MWWLRWGWIWILCIIMSPALATQSVTLAWDAVTTTTDGSPATTLAGYTMEVGTAVQSTFVPNITSPLTFTNLADATTYLFKVYAVDRNGAVSGPSNGVTYTTAQAPPQPPSATADSASTSAGAPVTINVLGNDTDPQGHTITVTSVTQGTLGMVTFTPTSVTYTPLAGTDHFSYTITNSDGLTATAQVTVNVGTTQPPPPPPPPPPPSMGLLAAYNCNETSGSSLTDSTGNGNTGTLGSGVSRTASGKNGGALVFNGGMVTIPSTPAFALSSAFTIEAWVYPTTNMPSWSTVVMKEQPGYFTYALYIGGYGTNIPAIFGVKGTTSATQVDAHAGSGLPLNTWTHLAGTWDGSILALYRNGALVTTTPLTAPIASSSNPLRLGANSIWGEAYTGRLDDLRLYNRALSLQEIQTDMATAVP